MSDMTRTQTEFLLRVRPADGGGFSASLRQFAGTAHPEVRAVLGVVSMGRGANEAAAMVAAISNAQLLDVREVQRGC